MDGCGGAGASEGVRQGEDGGRVDLCDLSFVGCGGAEEWIGGVMGRWG